MVDHSDQLLLKIDIGPDADDEELARLTQQLRAHLLRLDVDRVDLARASEAPEGSKAGDAVTWGTLLVTLASTGSVLPVMISTVQSWLSRDEQRTITIESPKGKLELSGASPQQQQQLIDAFLSTMVTP